MSQVQFFAITDAQYAALAVKDPGALYFLTDKNRIFKGTVPYSHPIELVTEFPAAGLVGTVYVNTATKEAKAWNGTAWVTIQMAINTVIGDAASDDEVPTAKAVKSYVDTAIEGVVAGGGAVTDVTYADKTITVKKGTASTTPLKLSGLVDGATFDGTSGKLTLTTNGGVPIEINLPVEQFLAAAAYDAETHILTLTMTDDSTFDVDLGDLIDVYTGSSTNSIVVAIDKGVVTANVKISATADNLIKVQSDGLYVAPVSWQTIE